MAGIGNCKALASIKTARFASGFCCIISFIVIFTLKILPVYEEDPDNTNWQMGKPEGRVEDLHIVIDAHIVIEHMPVAAELPIWFFIFRIVVCRSRGLHSHKRPPCLPGWGAWRLGFWVGCK